MEPAPRNLVTILPEQAHCAECGGRAEGDLFLYPTEQALAGAETASLCALCFSHKEDHTGHIVVTRMHAGHPAESPGERFAALFKAARVLLREQIGDEDKIIPTLRLAHKRGWRAPRIQYGTVRVVQVVEDVPILERVGVTARGRRSLLTDVLTHFAITLWPRSKKVSAKEIAGAYEKALKAEGVEWGKTGGRITYDLNQVRGYYVLLTVERSPFSKMREEAWPSPSLVGKVAFAALEEFSERLVIRRTGPQMSAENAILAMAAYLMKTSLPRGTEIERPKEINQLLNEHVLRQIPSQVELAEGWASSRSNQVWRGVDKITEVEMRTPERGPYEIK